MHVIGCPPKNADGAVEKRASGWHLLMDCKCLEHGLCKHCCQKRKGDQDTRVLGHHWGQLCAVQWPGVQPETATWTMTTSTHAVVQHGNRICVRKLHLLIHPKKCSKNKSIRISPRNAHPPTFQTPKFKNMCGYYMSTYGTSKFLVRLPHDLAL